MIQFRLIKTHLDQSGGKEQFFTDRIRIFVRLKVNKCDVLAERASLGTKLE